ncbi:MAG: hypothetical protein IJB29_02830 [Mailhella sp.]|nr:hypothetical protein [Mailhella sp.]
MDSTSVDGEIVGLSAINRHRAASHDSVLNFTQLYNGRATGNFGRGYQAVVANLHRTATQFDI